MTEPRTILAAVVLASPAGLPAACNTLDGIGEDVKAAHRAIGGGEESDKTD